MSYLSGFIGGISLCIIVWRGRVRAITSATVGSERPWNSSTGYLSPYNLEYFWVSENSGI